MAKCLTTLLLWSLMLMISGEDCPSTCETACTAADNGCSTCKSGYFGRKCQYPLQCVIGKGEDYHGTISITQNGRTCQMWNSQSPNKQSRTHLPENYCRNENSLESKPWCYNGEGTSPRFEDCNIPSCDTQCSVPTLYVFGDITNPPVTGFQVGVTVTILTGCGPGSIGKKTCQSDKTWSNAFDCTTIKWCPRPTIEANSFINNIQDEYYFDTKLEVFCVNGYEIAGSTKIIKCQGDKSWGTIPGCTKVQCAPPVLSDNRVIANPKSPYEYGELITIGCSDGYTVSGQNTLKCEANKLWSGTMPTCKPVPCPNLNLSPHSSIQSGKTSSFLYGDRVTIVCSKGYMVKGQVTLNCQSNGQWNGQPPTCEPVPCPMPKLPTYMSILNPKINYVFSDKIQLKCDKGFKINGVSEIVCQADSTWTEIPACTVIKCLGPILSENGIIAEGEKAEYVYGDSVGVNCSTGYTHQGNDTMTCYDNGLWVGTDWQCIVVKCSNPIKPENGIITEGEKADYVYRNSVVINCSSGYSLQRNNTMTCHHSGMWVEADWRCTGNEVTNAENENGANTMIGVAIGVAGVLFIEAIVLIVVFIRRRKQSSPGANSSTTEGGDKDAGQDYINLESDISGDTMNTNTYDVIRNRDPEHIYNELK